MATKKIVTFITDTRETATTNTSLSLLGEMSTKSHTFRQDVQAYSNPSYPPLLMTVFKDTFPQEYASLNAFNVNKILSVHSAIHNYISGSPTATKLSTVATISNTVPSISGFSIDDVIKVNNIPKGYGVARFNYTDDNNNSIEATVYFANSVLESDFPVTDMHIIPPISNITSLNTDEAGLQTLYNGIDFASIETAKSTYIANNTPTAVTAYAVNVYSDGADTDPTVFPFTAIGYGPQANDTQFIKNKLKDYLLTTITDPAEVVNWTNIVVKDLFNDIGYYIVPQYSSIALPMSGTLGTVYSPLINISAIGSLNTILTNMSQDFIDSNLEVFSFHYKGMSVVGVPGTGNSADNKSLVSSAMFPDYTNIEVTDTINYQRMSQRTREFITFIGDMIIHAEGLSPDPYPATYTDISIGTSTFIRDTFDGIEYFVFKKP